MAIPHRLTPPPPKVIGAAYTVTENDHGRTITADAVDLVVTLPAVDNDNAGMYVDFVVRTVSATTGLSLSPAAADNIDGGTDNKDLINTAATDAVGDGVRLTSNGITGWDSSLRTGTWAAEA